MSARTSLPGSRPTPATASSSLKVASSTRRRKVWKHQACLRVGAVGRVGVVHRGGRVERAGRQTGRAVERRRSAVGPGGPGEEDRSPRHRTSPSANPTGLGQRGQVREEGPGHDDHVVGLQRLHVGQRHLSAVGELRVQHLLDPRGAVSLVVPLEAQVRHAAGVVGVGVVVDGDAQRIGVGRRQVSLGGARSTIDGVGARQLVVGDAEQPAVGAARPLEQAASVHRDDRVRVVRQVGPGPLRHTGVRDVGDLPRVVGEDEVLRAGVVAGVRAAVRLRVTLERLAGVLDAGCVVQTEEGVEIVGQRLLAGPPRADRRGRCGPERR